MENKTSIVKGVAAGIAGGLVASVVMNQFQALLGKLMQGESKSQGAQSLQQDLPDHGISLELQERGLDDAEDNAAIRTGNAVSEFVFDHKLSKPEKEVAGTVAHYAMGMTSGAIYGAAAEIFPVATIGQGYRSELRFGPLPMKQWFRRWGSPSPDPSIHFQFTSTLCLRIWCTD